jgi:DNA repair protein SbcC/Rad50
MWQLTKLTATNICSFERLDYTPTQNQATLLFGNNLDNDSQNSNGSGKSALIEALAIGLIGEPLRKVNVDEIINDRYDTATITITLYNQTTNVTMVVKRILSRKDPQTVSITITSNDGEKEVVQASIIEYNKYVLDSIGLSKGDILRNFILTTRKYQSFLSSSDKDKKEIINRFSNGSVVDKSIFALQTNISFVQNKLDRALCEVANCKGRIEAVVEQIDNAITKSSERLQKKEQRIKELKQVIANKRSCIREQEAIIGDCNTKLDKYEVLGTARLAYEQSNKSISVCFQSLASKFQEAGLPIPCDYTQKAEQLKTQLAKLNEEATIANEVVATCEIGFTNAEEALKELTEKYDTFQSECDIESAKVNERINNLLLSVKELESKIDRLKAQRDGIDNELATLQKELAGVIVCPKCHQEFTLANDIDINRVRQQAQDKQDEINKVTKEIEADKAKTDNFIEKGRVARAKQNELANSRNKWLKDIGDAQSSVSATEQKLRTAKATYSQVQDKISAVQKDIDTLRDQMFDDFYNIVVEAFDNTNNKLRQSQLAIVNLNGAIVSYQESIKEVRKTTEIDLVETLKASKERYAVELKKATNVKETIERSLNTLKAQEAVFVEFKTYLANTKINAIAQITNDFLEAIGSDIRVNLSGYTVLKSGKVRDKISVSIVRDGIDCGSFDKFSAGEKCRVELASVLAMHRLCNINCDDGKGLNLLVIDEILDCTDETGLANVFKALNSTQVTALVVSHGNVAENYPNRLVVTKQNGISTINDIIKS